MLPMLKNYFKIAIRSLWKHKLFSLINVAGLGLALAFCFMQLIQVQSSFEKDSFHRFPERTYRILTDATGKDGEIYSLASTPMPLAEKLSSEQSVIEKSARVIRNFNGNLSNGIKTLRVNGMYVDPAYFDVFGFRLEKGKPAIDPGTVVLTHEIAERFFGNANPLGKTLLNKDKKTLTIVGVFASIGNFQTHLKSDMVISMATFSNLNPTILTDNWLDYNAYTFVLLTKGASSASLERALASVVEDNKKNVGFKEIKGHEFRSQKLSEISPDFENLLNNPYVEPIWKIGVSLLVPLVIMLLAGFNYINLTLTRSLSRAREVGVRKVAGAKRGQLIIQFLVETVVIALIALLIGYLGLLFLKSYIHVGWLVWEVQDSRILWSSFVTFTLLAGFLAGILPAKILSSYQPVQILKGEIVPIGVGKIGFRKVLTIVQFVVALVFMTFIGIMNTQFEFMATDNQNFNRKNILNVPLVSDSDFKLLSNEMSKQAGVAQVGVTSGLFNEPAGQTKISKLGGGAGRQISDSFIYSVDPDFISNMNLTFVAGENMPASVDSSAHFAVINQKAAHLLGYKNPKDVIGQSIMLREVPVIVSGVVKDFCIMRYELPVSPLVLAFDPREIKVLSFKISEGADREKTVAGLAKVWKKHHPHESFVYSWYEKQLYDDYIQGGDKRVTQIMVFIVFVIAGLGLLGMVNYTTEKRTKEVGVRKVLGASVAQIVSLLSWGFLKMILIAAVIALPLGYFAGAMFLKIFTYHPALGPGVFLTCLGSLLGIGLFTIGIQTYKTAQTNPAETLRAE